MTLSKAVCLLLVGVAATTARAPMARGAEEHSTADAHATADAHGPAGAHAMPNPMSFKTELAVWTWIVFAILLAVLWKFAWGPISEALDRREQKIADNIAAAEQCTADAKLLLAEYEAKLASAREEVRGILDEARRDAVHTGQEIVDKARADAMAEVDRGKREIETATTQALDELAKTSANLAVDLAGRIVSAKLNAADHARLIEDALKSFPKGDHQRN